MAPAVLHLSPHPDDELLGSGASLMALRDAGWRVVNLACGLGARPERRERRRSELTEACRRAAFELVVASPLVPLSDPARRAAAEVTLASIVAAACREIRPDVVVSPSPHDGHPAHESVGRATRRALEGLDEEDAPRWWMWGLWADLPLPTLLVPYGEERAGEIVHALDAHAAELERNDYRALVRARGTVQRVLGPERVLGHGTPGLEAPYADLLTEGARREGRWRTGAPRIGDVHAPGWSDGGLDLQAWLEAPGARALAAP